MKMSNSYCTRTALHTLSQRNFDIFEGAHRGEKSWISKPCCHGGYELATPRVVDVGINDLALYAIARPGGENEVASVTESSPSFRPIA